MMNDKNENIKEKKLPPGWPAEWPQNIDEFRHLLKTSDSLRSYFEDRGIELRYNEKTDKVSIWKIDKNKRKEG